MPLRVGTWVTIQCYIARARLDLRGNIVRVWERDGAFGAGIRLSPAPIALIDRYILDRHQPNRRRAGP